jgi:hypothetical protein
VPQQKKEIKKRTEKKQTGPFRSSNTVRLPQTAWQLNADVADRSRHRSRH